jgi:hypothetical protein
MIRNLAELDYRENNGIGVTLLWNRTTGRLVVQVVDECADEDFEIDCAPDEGLAAFHHPFAYAAQRPTRSLQRAVAD